MESDKVIIEDETEIIQQSQQIPKTEFKYVIIIGAGLAGLAAAKYIKKNKKDVKFIILEARDYIGGRVCTKKTAKGNLADLGASWIGPTQFRMYELCKEYKIGLQEQYEEQENILKVNDTRILKYKGLIPPLNILSLLKYQWTQWGLENLANTVVLGNPSQTPNAKQYDSITLENFLKTKLSGDELLLVQRGFQIVFGVACNKISLLYALYYVKSCFGLDSLFKGRGGAQHHKIQGGTSQITKAMSDEFKDNIILNSPVIEIRHEGEIVYVVTDQKEYMCAKLIVTVPPVIYKQIKMKPDWPVGKQIFMDGSKFLNQNYKIIIVYKNAFWRKYKLNGFVVQLKGLIMNLQCGQTEPKSEIGKLIGFIDADEYQKIKHLSQKEQENAFIQEVVAVLGEEGRDYIDFAMNGQLVDEKYVHGCPVGVTGLNIYSQMQENLNQPIGEQIYFAGTETAFVWHGYMEGAVISGEEAAARALGLKYNYKKPNIGNGYQNIIIIVFLVIIALLVNKILKIW